MPDDGPVSALVVGAHVWGSPPEAQLDHPTRVGLRARLGGTLVVVGRGKPGRWGAAPGPVVVHLPTGGGAAAFVLRAARSGTRLARDLSPPRVAVGSDVLGAVVASIVGRRVGAPVLVQVQGDVLRPGREYGGVVRRAVMGALMRAAVRRADSVRVVNAALAADVAALGTDETRIRVVGSRVDLDRFRPGPKAPTPTIVAVGTFAPVKNLEVLVRALAAVRARVSDAVLVLVGDGPSRGELERIASSSGVEDAVVFAGRLDHDGVAAEVRRAWVLALPSRSEGQPRVVLEAQASGTAVVASDLRSTREVVEDGVTGLLVPCDDLGGWVAACSAVLGDPALRDRLAGAALERVRADHDQERGLDALADVFRATAR